MSHGAQNTVQRNEERNRRVVTGKRTRHLADPDQEPGPTGVTEGRGGPQGGNNQGGPAATGPGAQGADLRETWKLQLEHWSKQVSPSLQTHPETTLPRAAPRGQMLTTL